MWKRAWGIINRIRHINSWRRQQASLSSPLKQNFGGDDGSLLVEKSTHAAEREALRLYRLLLEGDLGKAWSWQSGGCEVRAEMAVRMLNHEEVEIRKAWLFPRISPSGEETWPLGPADQAQSVISRPLTIWCFHVAPAVLLPMDKGVVTFVLDPALHDGPVEPELWMKAASGRSGRLLFTQSSVFMINEMFAFLESPPDNVIVAALALQVETKPQINKEGELQNDG